MKPYILESLLIRYGYLVGLTKPERIILHQLIDFDWDGKKYSFPSLSCIARREGTTTQGIIKIIKTLEKKGFLIVDRSKGRNNKYSFEILIELLGNLHIQETKNFKPEEIIDKLTADKDYLELIKSSKQKFSSSEDENDESSKQKFTQVVNKSLTEVLKEVPKEEDKKIVESPNGHSDEKSPKKKKSTSWKNSDEPATLQDFYEYTRKGQKHIKLIGWYAVKINASFDTKGQWDAFMNEHLKPAGKLKNFETEEIVDAVKYLIGAEHITEWNLHTVLKRITNAKSTSEPQYSYHKVD